MAVDMSIERVREYFRERGMESGVLEFDASSATVEDAAKVIGVESGRIAKTLSFYGSNGVSLVVCAGDAKIDNGKYKKEFGIKAKMLKHDETEALTGYAVGGVCPFAVNKGVKVYLDVSLKRFPTVFPACGSSNSAIELSIPELESCTLYEKWVDVSVYQDAN